MLSLALAVAAVAGALADDGSGAPSKQPPILLIVADE